MLPIAQKYIDNLGHKQAIRRFVADLMAGDPDHFKQGYSQENAIIAAAEAFDASREEVESMLSMTIKFGLDSIDSQIHMLNALSGFTVKGEWTNEGYPSHCSIFVADDNGVTITEVDDTGRPIINSTWLVGYDEILSITII